MERALPRELIGTAINRCRQMLEAYISILRTEASSDFIGQRR
jgi:hypothetical protein